MAKLIVIQGPDEGNQFELAIGINSLGRDRQGSIYLHDHECSRHHAEIDLSAQGECRIRDLGSANGTRVNTKTIREVPLHSGDHIEVGKTILVYHHVPRKNIESNPADQVRVVHQEDALQSSAIVRTLAVSEGSRILARPELAQTDWLKGRLANLSIMYESIQAVSHILDIDELLEKMMDLILTSIEADHGCMMLYDPERTEYTPKAVRYRSGVNHQEKMLISRTIMDYVLREKKGVLISDATKDERFSSGQSITHFHIHEVICVPMKGRHETLGVLFLDTQTSPQELIRQRKESGKLTDDHLALAIAIAHQAALAVEETRYHQALIQSERLAAIGQTITALSHHIKNIMQGIIFGSDMVRMSLNSTKPEPDLELLKKGWKLVEKNQARIHDLVMDMLNFSKDREPILESTDLNQLVRDVIDVVQGRIADHAIKFEVHLSETLPQIMMDPTGIHRALLNIVSNAIDAIQDLPPEKDRYLALQTILENDHEWVRIIVLDHGSGIPLEKQQEIFKPFVSSKGAKGTGLGLPVSQKILREHGGDILLQSQVGKGSKFVLRLPIKSTVGVEKTNLHVPLSPSSFSSPTSSLPTSTPPHSVSTDSSSSNSSPSNSGPVLKSQIEKELGNS